MFVMMVMNIHLWGGGLETLSIKELQNHINKAKQTTINILKQIEEENG